MKNLFLDYYYDKNNQFDEILNFLDCFQTPLYFILKHKVNGIGQPYELFLQDTTFELSHNIDGSRIDMDLSYRWSGTHVFDLEYVYGKGEQAVSEIKSFLEQEEIVMFQTNVDQVPFYRYFVSKDKPYDGTQNTQGHIFVALAMKEDLLYYLEAPWMLHESNFRPFNGSSTIGVIELSELKEAFDCYLNYYVVKIKNSGLYEEAKADNLIGAIRETTANFYKEPCIQDGKKLYYNNQALLTLIQFMEDGAIRLGEKHDYYTLNYCDWLGWKLITIKHKKIILIKCLNESSKRLQIPGIQSYIELLQKNTSLWQFIINMLNLKNKKKKLQSCSEIIKYLNKLIESEEKVFYRLNELLQEIHQ